MLDADALTPDQLACLLVVAGQDRPASERELWVPRARVEYDHGPDVVASLVGDPKSHAGPPPLVLAWLHPDGEQLCLTDAGGRALGLAIDERIDLLPTEDRDDDGEPVRYDVLLERDVWVTPPALGKGQRWGYRLPARDGMYPMPDPSLWPSKGRTPLEELIDAEAWRDLLGHGVKVDPETGALVEAVEMAGGGTIAGARVTILGAEVRVDRRGRRRAG